MLLIGLWILLYDLVVAASIIFIGNPASVLGTLTPKSMFMLLFDWRFLLGGFLALMARFIFVIINNLASKHPALAEAHLTLTAVATVSSIVAVVIVNHFFLDEQLTTNQIIGAVVVMVGLFLVFR